jgi:transglutaminase-like putative cysteine protease
MSKYSNYVPSNTTKPNFNTIWQQSHPGSVVTNLSAIKGIKKTVFSPGDTQFRSNNKAVVQMSTAQISQLAKSAAVNTAASGGTVSPMAASTNVIVTSATYTWYWTQGVSNDNEVTIYNPGPSTASGMVIIWSEEDGYGYGSYFYNLGVGAYTTVSVPFTASTGTSVGIKPIDIVVTDLSYNPSDWVQLSDGIERYNNAAGYLTDPYGGDSLSTDDLHHFPFNDGYPIIYEAAVAGDNTATPNDTAYHIMGYVNTRMNYSLMSPWDGYTASDLYITSHGTNGKYNGVCDEYATLFTSFERSLGAPTQYYLMTFNNQTGYVFGHAITQIWSGSGWVSVDPTWDSFNDPQVYKRAGNLNVTLTRMSGANDSIDTSDPSGDGLLKSWTDFGTIQPLGIVPAYN